MCCLVIPSVAASIRINGRRDRFFSSVQTRSLLHPCATTQILAMPELPMKSWLRNRFGRFGASIVPKNVIQCHSAFDLHRCLLRRIGCSPKSENLLRTQPLLYRPIGRRLGNRIFDRAICPLKWFGKVFNWKSSLKRVL